MRADDDRYFPPPKDDDLVLKVAIGVIVGILVVFLLIRLERQWEINQALNDFNSVMNKVGQEVNASIEADRRAQLAREAAIAQAQERGRREAEILADQAAARASYEHAMLERARLDQIAKETAWSRYYKPSAECQFNNSTVECANQYARAKKQFEAMYVASHP